MDERQMTLSGERQRELLLAKVSTVMCCLRHKHDCTALRLPCSIVRCTSQRPSCPNDIGGMSPTEQCASRSGTEEESAPDGNVVVARLMGGVEYGRPLATGWTGTLGVNWQRAKCLNEHGNCITQVRLLVAHCLDRPLRAIVAPARSAPPRSAGCLWRASDLLWRQQRHIDAGTAASRLQRAQRHPSGGIHGAGPPPAVQLAQLQPLLCAC